MRRFPTWNAKRWGKRRIVQVAILGVLAIAAVIREMLPAPGVEDVAGRAQVIDGDSLRVGGREIRLDGIDAPEGPQMCEREGKSWACGREAQRLLNRLASRGTVECKGLDVDKHDRLLALCRQGDYDLNREMVLQGFAVSYGRFRAEERNARDARRGMWAGEFQRPRDWRRERNIGL